MSVPLENDAAYWRKMYEERLALEEAGFTALLAERDHYREALLKIAAGPNSAPYSERWSRAEALVALLHEERAGPRSSPTPS